MENLRYQRSVIMTGYDDGLQEGRAEGRAEGADQQKMQTAKMMLEDGESVEKVMRYTGLTQEQIDTL